MPFQLKIKEWYIYYSHNTVIKGNTLDEWHQAPNEDVQVILLFYENGKPEVFRQKDLYCMWKNQHGLRFEMCMKGDGHSYPDECQPDGIKCGISMDTNAFLKIVKQAEAKRDGA